MPRVNRDVERRMAERRDRERRRQPSQRRYKFQAPDEVGEEEADTKPRSNTEQVSSSRVRGPVVQRTTLRTSGDNYGLDYRYVLTDLRRVVAVIGFLLILMTALFFVLPH